MIARGTTENGIKVGEWSYYYANGNQLARGSYEKGLPSGLWQYWHASGHLWMAGEYVVETYEDRDYFRLDGLWIVLTDEGRLDLSEYSQRLKCDGIAMYTVGPWAERVDWDRFTKSGCQVLLQILPPTFSWKGAGYYPGGSRTHRLRPVPLLPSELESAVQAGDG